MLKYIHKLVNILHYHDGLTPFRNLALDGMPPSGGIKTEFQMEIIFNIFELVFYKKTDLASSVTYT